jgi:hypothetical protein
VDALYGGAASADECVFTRTKTDAALADLDNRCNAEDRIERRREWGRVRLKQFIASRTALQRSTYSREKFNALAGHCSAALIAFGNFDALVTEYRQLCHGSSLGPALDRERLEKEIKPFIQPDTYARIERIARLGCPCTSVAPGRRHVDSTKSVSGELHESTMEVIWKEIMQGFVLPVTTKACEPELSLLGFEVQTSPLYAIPKTDALGNTLLDKIRIILDLTAGGLNHTCIETLLAGQVFLPTTSDIALKIAQLQREHPTARILMRTIDIAGAFRLMPLATAACKTMGYSVDGITLQCLTAPFGWSDAPGHFQGFAQALKQRYESMNPGRRCKIYVDDSHLYVVLFPADNDTVVTAQHEADFVTALHAVCGPDSFNRTKDAREALHQWGYFSAYIGRLWDTGRDMRPDLAYPVGACEAMPAKVEKLIRLLDDPQLDDCSLSPRQAMVLFSNVQLLRDFYPVLGPLAQTIIGWVRQQPQGLDGQATLVPLPGQSHEEALTEWHADLRLLRMAAKRLAEPNGASRVPLTSLLPIKERIAFEGESLVHVGTDASLHGLGAAVYQGPGAHSLLRVRLSTDEHGLISSNDVARACSELEEAGEDVGVRHDDRDTGGELSRLEKFGIAIAELSVVVGVVLKYGAKWRNRLVLVNIDNTNVVHWVNMKPTRSKTIRALQRFLALICVEFGMAIRGTWVSSFANPLPDILSRLDEPGQGEEQTQRLRSELQQLRWPVDTAMESLTGNERRAISWTPDSFKARLALMKHESPLGRRLAVMTTCAASATTVTAVAQLRNHVVVGVADGDELGARALYLRVGIQAYRDTTEIPVTAFNNVCLWHTSSDVETGSTFFTTLELATRDAVKGVGPICGCAEMLADSSSDELVSQTMGMLRARTYETCVLHCDAAEFGETSRKTRQYLLYWRQQLGRRFPIDTVLDERDKHAAEPSICLRLEGECEDSYYIPREQWAHAPAEHCWTGERIVGRTVDTREPIYDPRGKFPEQGTGETTSLCLGGATGLFLVRRGSDYAVRRLMPIESGKSVGAVDPEVYITGDQRLDQSVLGKAMSRRLVAAILAGFERLVGCYTLEYGRPINAALNTAAGGDYSHDTLVMGGPKRSSQRRPEPCSGKPYSTDEREVVQSLAIQLIQQRVAPSTSKKTQMAWNHWRDFIFKMSHDDPFLGFCAGAQGTMERTRIFVQFLVVEHLLYQNKASYAVSKIDSVATHFMEHGLPDPREGLHLLAAVRRSLTKAEVPPTKKQPFPSAVTVLNVRENKRLGLHRRDLPLKLGLDTAQMTLQFSGMRSSEALCSSPTGTHPNDYRVVKRKDVAFYRRAQGVLATTLGLEEADWKECDANHPRVECVVLLLRFTKTVTGSLVERAKAKRGIAPACIARHIAHRLSDDPLVCPVKALQKWISVATWLTPDAPLFSFRDGTTVTKTMMHEHLCEQVRRYMPGVDEREYSTYSMRHALATEAKRAGVDERYTKTMGGWKSSAVRGYQHSNKFESIGLAKTLLDAAVRQSDHYVARLARPP